MLNTTYTGIHAAYTITRELGKGGEGTVYELNGEPDKVLKIYSEALDNDKVKKLRYMCLLDAAKVKEYAAWPLDAVADSHGNTVGFVMKKLANYVPLHMLFSPMDRKKLFPDKGYNFLVHVAKNLATAFYVLHSAGLIVGDVNEGNILVNQQGMVAFIDCDSFQVQEGSHYYYCEVGVPRYTPPELLEKSTFQHIVRTANTDSFSLAVLVFQLLFLGRHPFAGKNVSNEDIDEETAIRRHLFAYSLHNNQNKLLPPADSFSIQYLPQSLAELFHLSFENRIARPLPADWTRELHSLLQNMSVCSQTKLHVYPAGIKECPWCAFRYKRNILYFLDDALLQTAANFSNMEAFIQGFRIDRLQFVPISVQSLPGRQLMPNSIDKKYRYYSSYHIAAIIVLVCAGVASLLLSMLTKITFAWLAINVLIFIGRKALPWKKALREELYIRGINKQTRLSELEAAIDKYNYSPEAGKYTDTGEELDKLITDYKALPSYIQNRRKAIEEQLYNEQLTLFLSAFTIADAPIPGFGSSRKKSLYAAGIYTAADVYKLQQTKVQGIGPKYMQTLLSWQRQMSTSFVYHPHVMRLNKEYQQVQAHAEAEKRSLENSIKNRYQALEYIKMNFAQKQAQLMRRVEEKYEQYLQADADYAAFEQLQ